MSRFYQSNKLQSGSNKCTQLYGKIAAYLMKRNKNSTNILEDFLPVKMRSAKKGNLFYSCRKNEELRVEGGNIKRRKWTTSIKFV